MNRLLPNFLCSPIIIVLLISCNNVYSESVSPVDDTTTISTNQTSNSTIDSSFSTTSIINSILGFFDFLPDLDIDLETDDKNDTVVKFKLDFDEEEEGNDDNEEESDATFLSESVQSQGAANNERSLKGSFHRLH